MAQINLKEYQAKIARLLRQGQSDEVIAHAEHILARYPKNLMAHRHMAAAQLAVARYDDAEKSYRKVLSALPSDVEALVGLGRVALHRRKFNEAIWYFERAYEQNPADTQLLNELRDLYSQHRGIESVRIQQGARAVAEQQLRAGLYHRAIDTLQNALLQSPDRPDLRVLLAQSLWENGARVEAAEVAMEVIRTLPNCLPANRIMTELWLAERRPSDAQRYLAVIESLDPYLASDIVQGAPPPDNAYLIDELDYEREANRRLATLEPDWLGSFSDDFVADDAPAADFQPAAFEPTTDDMDTLYTDDDWLRQLDGAHDEAQALTRGVSLPADVDAEQRIADMFGEPDPPAAHAPASPEEDETADASLVDLFDFDEEPAFEDDTEPATGRTGLTGLLEALEGDDADPQASADRRDDAGLPEVIASTPTAFLDDDDPFDDLDTSEPPIPSNELFGLVDDVDEDNDDDQSLEYDWINRADLDAQARPTAPLPPASVDDFLDEAVDDWLIDLPDDDAAEDPLAWARQSGIEIDDAPDEESEEYDPYSALGEQAMIEDPNAEDPFAWMKESGIEIINDEEEIDESLDWMLEPEDLPDEQPQAASEPAVDLFADDEPDAEPGVAARTGLTGLLSKLEDDDSENELLSLLETDASANVDFALDLQSDYDDSSSADYLSDDLLAELSDEDEEDELDAMNDDYNERQPDWFASSDDDDAGDDDNNNLEWLSDLSDDDTSDDEDREFVAQAGEGGFMADDDAFAFGDDSDTPESEEEPAVIPDWLNDLSGANDQSDEPAAMPDWLLSVGGEEVSDEDPDADEYMLFGSNEDDEEDDDESSLFVFTSIDDEDDDIEADGFNPEAEEEAVPDWLASVGGGSAAEDDELDLDEDEAGLLELDDFDPDDDDQMEEEAVPDWLASVGGGSIAEDDEADLDEDEAGLLELDDFDLDDDDQMEEEAVPDWLASVGGGSIAEDDEADLDEDEPDFLIFGADDEDDEDEQALVFDSAPASAYAETDDFDFDQQDEEMLDWLSEPALSAEAVEEDDPGEDYLPMDDVPDWLADADVVSQEAAVASVADDTPDWLAGFGASASGASFAEADDEANDDVYWLSEVGDEGEDEESIAETPAWLNEPAADDDAAGVLAFDELDDAQPAALYDDIAEDADLIYADQVEDEWETTDLVPANNAPDWLNAMVPGLDVDYEKQEEDDPVEQAYLTESQAVRAATDFDWLIGIVDEELRPPASLPVPGSIGVAPVVMEDPTPKPAPRFVLSRPPLWLRGRGKPAQTPLNNTNDDWLDFDDDER